MTEAIKLFSLYDQDFTAQQRSAVNVQFQALAEAYPEKCHHNGGYTDLWLTAIADIRDNASPWL